MVLLAQGLILKDCEPLTILKQMSLYATLILMLAVAALERDAWGSLPALQGNAAFYGGLALNCSLAMASNFLNICVTRATSPLTLQVPHIQRKTPCCVSRGDRRVCA